MKAIVIDEFGGPEVLRYCEVPDLVLSPASVLIEVRAAGVNRGDLQRRAGQSEGDEQALPLVIGWEVAGVVKAAGQLVQHVQPGDRVVAIMPSGGYAELAAPIALAAVPIPPELSFEEAAGIPVVFMTAWFALVRKAALRPGETALIQAAGSGVGMARVQIARHIGARVIATAGSDDKLARARELGADETINYRTTDFADAVMAITGGRGVDVVLESVGGRTLVKSIELLASGGRLVSVGNSSEEPVSIDAALLVERDVSLSGLYLGNELLRSGAIEEFQKVVDLCGRGELKVIVDRVLPLAEAAAAHRILADRANFGKIILKP
ncbi:MAG: quinone oxidoreductase family protein [Dehalococcoidia bacterium]